MSNILLKGSLLFLLISHSAYGEAYIDFDQLIKEKNDLIKKIKITKSLEEKELLEKKLQDKRNEINSILIILQKKRTNKQAKK